MFDHPPTHCSRFEGRRRECSAPNFSILRNGDAQPGRQQPANPAVRQTSTPLARRLEDAPTQGPHSDAHGSPASRLLGVFQLASRLSVIGTVEAAITTKIQSNRRLRNRGAVTCSMFRREVFTKAGSRWDAPASVSST